MYKTIPLLYISPSQSLHFHFHILDGTLTGFCLLSEPRCVEPNTVCNLEPTRCRCDTGFAGINQQCVTGMSKYHHLIWLKFNPKYLKQSYIHFEQINQ